MIKRLAGALVTLLASKLAVWFVRLAQRSQTGTAPRRDVPLENQTFCLDNPNGMFVYGRVGFTCLVLPEDGAWRWRVAVGDVRQTGRENDRPTAKRTAVETLVAMERMGVQ